MVTRADGDAYKIVNIADIHIGNRKIHPRTIEDNLIKYLYPELEDADILLIAGDFFDTLLDMDAEAGMTAAIIIDDLINLANKHSFYIRVLRGTFTHDRNQNRFFKVRDRGNHKLHGMELIRVMNTVEIELFPEMDNLSIVYCPDEISTDPGSTIIEAIKSQKFKSVDVLCSHGYFKHLLPYGIPHVPKNTIDWQQIKKYINCYVINGHIHNNGVYDNKVISSGSFERLTHGTESKKGFFNAYIHKDRKYELEFVENQGATPFNTISVDNFKDTEEILAYIDRMMLDHQNRQGQGSALHLRIIGKAEGISAHIRAKYPAIKLTNEINKKQAEKKETHFICNDLPIITEENLPELIKENTKGLSIERIKEILS